MHWILSVTKQMSAVDYDDRLKVSRELTAAIGKHKLRHASYREAAAAAVAISRSPLVVRVTVTQIHEQTEGVWRNGKKS